MKDFFKSSSIIIASLTGFFLLFFSMISSTLAAQTHASEKQDKTNVSDTPLNPKQQALLKLLLPSLSASKNDYSKEDLINPPTEIPLTPNAPNNLNIQIQQNIQAQAFTVINPFNSSQGMPRSITSVSDLNPYHANLTANGHEHVSPSKLMIMENIALIGGTSHTQLILRFNNQPIYDLSSDDSHKILSLNLQNIDPRSLINPLDINNTALQKIDYSYDNQHQLVIKLFLSPLAEIQGLRMVGTRPTQLVMDLGIGSFAYSSPTYNQNNKTPGPYQPLKKTLSTWSTEDREETMEYDKAVNLMAHQHMDSAKILLENSLKKNQTFEKARIALGEIYLNQNLPKEALKLLTEINFSDAPENQVANHIDYYTVLAEAYRQAGEPLNAANVYQALLNFDPNNSVWWTGLGMCFDALNQKNDAHDAFAKANSLGNLPLPLKNFIEKQLGLSPTEAAST